MAVTTGERATPSGRRTLLIALACASMAAEPAADRLVTRDGRVLNPKKAREEGPGYRLVFENGEIVLADRAAVASVEIEGEMSEYVPRNDDEREKLVQGYVRYRGKWLSKPAYEAQLRKEHEESRARTERLAEHSAWFSAWTDETAHFLLRSNTSQELIVYYGELLEAYYRLMDDRLGIRPSPIQRRTKMQVNIYKSREEFRELAPWPGGDMPPGVAGFFAPFDATLNFFHDYEDPAKSTWVGLHECTHLLTYLIGEYDQPQIWINEAVADYFGSSRVERTANGKLVIQPGEPQTDRVLTVQQAIDARRGRATATGSRTDAEAQRPDIELEEMFRLTRDGFGAFEYAHAWSFVYFLNTFDGGRYSKGFARFFKGLYTLEKGVPSVASQYGRTVRAEDVRDYLLSKLGHKDCAELEQQWKEHIASIRVEAPAALLKRGLMKMARFEFQSALADVDAALAAGIEDPRAWWARARCRALTGKPEDGRADLERAIELDPLNARYRYELSTMLAGRHAALFGVRAAPDQHAGGERISGSPEAKRQAGLATELAPGNDLYLGWYARFE